MRNQGAIAGDNVGTNVNGRYVQCRVVGGCTVGQAPSRYDGRATRVIEDPEWLVEGRLGLGR